MVTTLGLMSWQRSPCSELMMISFEQTEARPSEGSYHEPGSPRRVTKARQWIFKEPIWRKRKLPSGDGLGICSMYWQKTGTKDRRRCRGSWQEDWAEGGDGVRWKMRQNWRIGYGQHRSWRVKKVRSVSLNVLQKWRGCECRHGKRQEMYIYVYFFFSCG